MKAWGKYELPDRAPPLPASYAAAMAAAALATGEVILCLLILVAFSAFLRTGEIVQVRAAHFLFNEGTGPVLLSLPVTKSGQRGKNTPETLVLSDPLLTLYIRVVIPRLHPQELLWPYGEAAFRQAFSRLVKKARLPAAGWRPYSLRRGGATAYFLETGSLDLTTVRGRWQSSRTARIYLDEAVAFLATLRATPAQSAHIRRLERMLHSLDALRGVSANRS